MFATAIILTILQTSNISIGGQTVRVEIADTPETRDKGLMGRTHLPQGAGMLFVFEKPLLLSFWMKNTLIPLSIAFFDEKKKLIETLDMPVPVDGAKNLPLFKSSKPALYALEVPKNWFRENEIEEGMEFSFLDSSNSVE